jgi:hypothetical protein
MKTTRNLLVFALLVVLGSCATTSKFPVSSIVPAADISAKKTTDKNNNITLEITAKNLASPDRISPAGNNYSIWVVTRDFGIKNVGQLTIRNAKKTSFKTLTPFDFNEVIITVENQGDLMYPAGTEISRTKM